MDDGDIDIVLRSIKKSIQEWPIPLMERLVVSKPDPFALLVACVLSLRTRDSATAGAYDRLFPLADSPFSMARLSVKKIEKAIYPVGFYRTKARQIQKMSQKICDVCEGKVPEEIEELVKLPGVGRKTANLVRTLGYQKPGICVDVHVHRISNRLGYVTTKYPDDTETVLRRKLPQKHWMTFNGLLVPFGQYRCTPASPKCSVCSIRPFCKQTNVQSFR